MTPFSLVVLHGAAGAEVELATYLARVFLHLLALGGIAALVYSVSRVAETVRATFAAD